MSFEHYSPRAVAGSTIVFVHTVVLYALATVGPRIESDASLPLLVRFVSSAESRPQWQPPRVTAVMPAVFSQAPQLPLIEIPAAPPLSNRAISVAAAPGVPTMNSHQDRNSPKWVAAVEYVREPAPRYPPQSRRLREQGLVVLRVLIDEQGNARHIDIESSSGHERLDHAAREAIERAAFRPYLEDGTPRRALVLIPVEFTLNRGSA